MNLLSMGLATSPAFRRKFMALNRVLDKRARYWRTDIFRQDFCAVSTTGFESAGRSNALRFPGFSRWITCY